jgi:hypothetical protein
VAELGDDGCRLLGDIIPRGGYRDITLQDANGISVSILISSHTVTIDGSIVSWVFFSSDERSAFFNAVKSDFVDTPKTSTRRIIKRVAPVVTMTGHGHQSSVSLPPSSPRDASHEQPDATSDMGSSVSSPRDDKGRVDVRAAIRQLSKRVHVHDLAQKQDHVRVMNMKTIRILIQEAVHDAMHHVTASLSESEKERLLKEAEDGFQERMKAFEAQKLSAETRAAQLAEHLKSAQKTLEEERKRAIASEQFTISEDGMRSLEARIKEMISTAASDHASGDIIASTFENALSLVLGRERDRKRIHEEEAHNASIVLLEKKIQRLSQSLEEVERQRDEARDMISSGSGSLAVSGQKYTAGMKADDPRRTRKLELMKELAEQNRALRKALGIAVHPAIPSASDPHAVASVTVTAGSMPDNPLPSHAVMAVATTASSSLDESSLSTSLNHEAVDPDDLPWEPTGDAVSTSFTTPGR